MKDQRGYIVPPFVLGQPIVSHVVGRVVRSSDPPTFPEGSLVTGMLPWQQRQDVALSELRRVPEDVLKVGRGLEQGRYVGVCDLPDTNGPLVIG
jgi:NADPH-dependent curcumin reductase CurA